MLGSRLKNPEGLTPTAAQLPRQDSRVLGSDSGPCLHWLRVEAATRLPGRGLVVK